MTSLAYGNATPQAQAVIDTAINVWMQMGLTEDQILYGIAMMKVESGYNPVVSNHVKTDSIRGLGQFNTATWNATAESFDAQYGLQYTPILVVRNSAYNINSPEGTNAQAGESNDPGAGFYDPAGLAPQLEVLGQGIIREWQQATSLNDLFGAEELYADGAAGASLLVQDSPANSGPNAALLSTVALAYLNHHEGFGWWSINAKIPRQNGMNQTISHMSNPSTGLASALQQVVSGVQGELDYLSSLTNPTGTAADLIIGDPWTLSGADLSLSEAPTGSGDISHDIPSIFPTIDNFYSQTAGTLNSYVVDTVTHGSTSNLHTDDVSYTYSSTGTQPTDVVSGTAEFNFDSHNGSGTETFENGSTLTYNEVATAGYYTLSSTTSQGGTFVATLSETATQINGEEYFSQVFGNGSAVTGGQLGYIVIPTEFETEGVYDDQGRLINVLTSSSTAATQYHPISTTDPNYEQEAIALSIEFAVPIIDQDVLNGSSSQQAFSATTFNSQGSITTDSSNYTSQATTNADPGFQAAVLQTDGNTLGWSFNADGTIKSRDIVNSAGNTVSQDFESTGSYIGTSTTSVDSEGNTFTQTYDTQGNSNGSTRTVHYASGEELTVNGVTTYYANGVTITDKYASASSGGGILEVTISSTAQNADGSYTTTELNYQPITNSNGTVSDLLLGSTITDVSIDGDSTSTDYDANGNVTGSRVIATNGNGLTSLENFNALGALVGSDTLSIDAQGDIIFQSYNSAGTLTDSKELTAGGSLIDTQYQDGSVSGVATSTATADGGSLTTYTNSSGDSTGDQWVLSNGAYGSDTVQAGGSVAGTSHFTDGTSSSSLYDGSGNITTTNYNAAGVVTGTTSTAVVDGTVTSQFVAASGRGSTSGTVRADGSIAAIATLASGTDVGVSLDTSGNVSWTTGTSNGATTADIVDSNGDLTGTSVTSVARDGSITVTDFDSTGMESGYSQTATSDGVTTTIQYTDGAGVFTESGYTQTAINADGSVTTTDYTVTGGVSTETGYSDTVTNANGSATTTFYELNSVGVLVGSGTEVVSEDDQGHVTTANYDSGGELSGYTLERTDSSGDVLIAQYDSTGDELRSTTVEASGVVSDVVFDSSNGTVTTTWETDGSYQQTTDDGEGDVTTIQYAANGDEESDTWTQGDGSFGQDTVNADGSVLSESNDGQGNLTTSTTSASGEVTSVTDYYDHGSLTADVDTDNSSWGLLGSTRVVTSADGLTTTTSNFNSSGSQLNSDTVVTSSDGLTVTTTSYDGSGTLLGTTTNVTSADGSIITESDYDASGNLTGYQAQVTSSDGNTVTASSYNGSGQLQGSTVAVTSSDGLTVTTSTYDGSQNLLGVSVAVTSADGQTTTTTDYNADNVSTGQTVILSSENGTASSTYTYNALGEMTSDQVAFTGGVEPGNLKISAASVNGAPSLVIVGPTDSITLPAGLSADVAAVTSVTFDVGVTMSLDQLVQHAASLGNVSATTIAGAFGNLIFDPDSGDSLTGGTGQDTLSAWGNNDTLTAGANGSAMYSLGNQARIIGSATGTDTLSASGPNSTLIGGTGSETFEVNETNDVVEAQAGAESNTLLTSVNYVLPTHVDEATLTGGGNLFVQGNSDAANVITGNSGDDTLVAGTGSDTLIAGTGVDELVGSYGGDEFVINSSSDEVFTNGYGYGDTIESSVSYTVTQSGFVNTLILTGAANLTATDADGYVSITGNAGDDTLIGGSGSDTLVAGSGVDTLISGSGGNTLVVDNAADVIELSPGAAGKDTLESSVGETLMGGLDNLVLTGSDDLVGQGNDDAGDTITGNMGSDTLIAGSGNDELIAGSGNDTLIAGVGNDTLEGSTSGGSDTFVFNAGSGATLIDLSTIGAATIQFGMGITAADLSVGVVNNSGDLQLQITDGSSVLTLDDGSQGQFGFVTDSGLDFSFADGSTLTLGQLLATAQVQSTTIAGAYGNLVLDSADDTSLTGGFGDDTLIASGSDDTIAAGAGAQLLAGYGDGDVLAAGSGDDTLVGGVNSTLVTGSGNSVIYGGAQNNTYVLTEGTSTTIYASSGSAGVQTLLLPTGMTDADFTSFLAPNGDLIIQSTSGDTSAVIKGYASNGSAAVWFIADQNGDDGQLLDSWVASNSGGSSTGGSQPSSYQQEVTGLMAQYKVYLQDTLEQFGSSDLTLGYPYDPSSSPVQNNEYYQYTFTGINTENLTVQGGSLSVGASQNSTDQSQQTQTGTETQYYAVPIYETVTIPGYIDDLPPQDGDTVVVSLSNAGDEPQGDYSNGQLTGYSLYIPPHQETIQVGVQTESYTVPVYTYYTTATMGLTLYNITGDGGSDVINAASSFVGTVVTGDGNDVNVDLGIYTAPINGYYGYSYSYPEVMSPGAFIDVGNGINDTIAGTGGADAVAAGLGFDNILVGEGSTVYVPMEGTSTEIINYFQNPEYGNGPFPLNTLVLPEGITPQDLQFKLVIVIGVGLDSGPEAIQITYGDSTVLAYFYPQNGPYVQNAAPNSVGGTNYFEFSDGTVLTRAQVLALAGPAQFVSLDGPTVTPLAVNVAAETTVSAADLFSASADANGDVRLYQITNSAGSGAYFVLNGAVYTPGETFQIGADQLSQLQYVAGTAGSGDTVSVAAFDGITLGNTTTFPLWVPTPATVPGLFVANGPNESVVGTSTGPDTITGGYGGDALVGTSGEDIFTYSAGSGAEMVTEAAPTSASSSNVVQFGSGITASSMTASLAANGGLVLSTGTPGDSLTIEGFAPLDPLNSMPIQQFQFADGTSLTFAQLLSTVQSSGTEQDVTSADGTTTAYAFDLGSGSIYYAKTLNTNSQPVQDYYLNADGSTRTDSFSYYQTQAYDTQVRTAASGATTTLSNYYELSSDGSYTDDWGSSDGSYGTYWWNASTQSYVENWTDTNGTTWTDDYQYASGGSPGSTGVSFTETYNDSSGDQGTRQYNASTGVTSVTWYSAATGTTTTGTVSDSGFIGLQNDGVLTNYQPDPSFFNPATSPTFQNFLAGH